MHFENDIKIIENVEDFNCLKFGDTFGYYCIKCSKLNIIHSFRKHRVRVYSNFMCSVCGKIKHMNYELRSVKTEDTNLKRYGYKNPAQSPIVKEKIYKTNLKRYGCAIATQNSNVANKISNTLNNKTDREWSEIVNKRKSTNLKLYNAEYASQSDKVKNKVRLTNIERYGFPNAMQNPEIKNKLKESWKHKTFEEKQYIINEAKLTKKERYGDEKYNNQDKNKKTCLERYGVEQVLSSPEMREYASIRNETINGDRNYTNREKATLTNIQRYGFPNVMQNPEIKNKAISNKYKIYGNYSGYRLYNYYGITFDSSWELAVWIYCIDHNIPIIREPVRFEYYDINNKRHYYIPDFSISGKLVELKGDQYFSSNRTMIYPYNTKKLSGTWIPMTDDEKRFMDDLYERKHQCGLANNVSFWCIDDVQHYLDYCNMMYPGWNIKYRVNNVYNPSYWVGYFPIIIKDNGFTPYNCDMKEKYTPIIGKGVSPFDIIK